MNRRNFYNSILPYLRADSEGAIECRMTENSHQELGSYITVNSNGLTFFRTYRGQIAPSSIDTKSIDTFLNEAYTRYCLCLFREFPADVRDVIVTYHKNH